MLHKNKTFFFCKIKREYNIEKVKCVNFFLYIKDEQKINMLFALLHLAKKLV